MDIWMIAGLGNPGQRYRNTRHNVGFAVTDRVCALANARFMAAPRADLILHRAIRGDRVWFLVKPMTYMNQSGIAVSEMAGRLGLDPGRILVVYDCLDLSLGRIRLRPRGSSGGHRGVESVIRELGTDQFPRLRVGIGRPESMTAIDYVLSEWTAAEQPVLDRSLSAAADAVLMTACGRLDEAMNRYNGWDAAEDSAKRTQGESSIEDV